MKTKLLLGDNVQSLKKLPDNSIDSIVSDPPYGLSFMGKKWDYDVPSVDFWKEVYRVLKPGGHVLSFGGTRTYHRMTVNIEDAGFEIRDQIMWLYGSGFPKSHNISKAIDKKYGRLGYDLTEIKTKLKDLYKASGKTMTKIDEECGFRASGYLRIEHRDDDGWGEALPTEERWKVISEAIGCSEEVFNEYSNYFSEAEREITGKANAGFLEKNNVFDMNNEGYGNYDLTKSKTPEGQKWEGWGTALKPANEPICVARKPLSEKSVAENVLKWGTGGINIDGCRVGSEGGTMKGGDIKPNIDPSSINIGIGEVIKLDEGRFPANIILECICDEIIKGDKGEVKKSGGSRDSCDLSHEWGYSEIKRTNFTDKGDIHTNPMCPCYLMDEQSGISKSRTKYPEVGLDNLPMNHYETTKIKHEAGKEQTKEGFTDKGGASRFFYQAKVSKAERNMGLDDFEDKTSQLNSGGIGRKTSVEKRLDSNGENAPTTKNSHPTVKPVSLMAYLCRLVTPPNGIVLDPFMGSGSTGIAARLEGFKFCGMEMDADYFKIAEKRIENFESYRKFIK